MSGGLVILVGCIGFVIGLGCGLLLSPWRPRRIPARPVSPRRMSRLDVIDPGLVRQHVTVRERREQ